MSYLLFVADHAHYMEEPSAPRSRFEDLAAAVAAAQAIVEDSLRELHTPGMTANALHSSYMRFGEDPYVIATDGERVEFSALAYARQRCTELCGDSPGA